MSVFHKTVQLSFHAYLTRRLILITWNRKISLRDCQESLKTESLDCIHIVYSTLNEDHDTKGAKNKHESSVRDKCTSVECHPTSNQSHHGITFHGKWDDNWFVERDACSSSAGFAQFRGSFVRKRGVLQRLYTSKGRYFWLAINEP